MDFLDQTTDLFNYFPPKNALNDLHDFLQTQQNQCFVFFFIKKKLFFSIRERKENDNQYSEIDSETDSQLDNNYPDFYPKSNSENDAQIDIEDFLDAKKDKKDEKK